MANHHLLTKKATIAPRLSAAQSTKSNCLPGIKNFWINSVVSPHRQTANVIFMNRLILSFLSIKTFLNALQNRNTIPPKSPACTSLSKLIKSSHPVSGILSPGKHTKMSTNKNQAMPGKKLTIPNCLEELLFNDKSFMKPGQYRPGQ